MLRRKIWIDNGRYASCEIDNYGETDVYLFSSEVDLKDIVTAMERNGIYVKKFHEDDAAIVVDRTKFFFKGKNFTLNQWFNGPITLLIEILKKHKYNRSNTIFCECDINDDNTIVTATYFTKEFKMFQDI